MEIGSPIWVISHAFKIDFFESINATQKPPSQDAMLLSFFLMFLVERCLPASFHASPHPFPFTIIQIGVCTGLDQRR